MKQGSDWLIRHGVCSHDARRQHVRWQSNSALFPSLRLFDDGLAVINVARPRFWSLCHIVKASIPALAMEERRLSQQTTQAPTGSDLDLEREPTQEEIWRKPWKYKGYPAFATWMASADDFMVLRRFSRLNARVLLLMQDRIVQKEEELDRMDVSSRKCSTADYDGNCSTFRFEPCMRRREVLEELEPMLKEYSESNTLAFFP